MTLDAQDQYFKIWAIQPSSVLQHKYCCMEESLQSGCWFGLVFFFFLFPPSLADLSFILLYPIEYITLFLGKTVHKKFARDRETAGQLVYRRWAQYNPHF